MANKLLFLLVCLHLLVISECVEILRGRQDLVTFESSGNIECWRRLANSYAKDGGCQCNWDHTVQSSDTNSQEIACLNKSACKDSHYGENTDTVLVCESARLYGVQVWEYSPKNGSSWSNIWHNELSTSMYFNNARLYLDNSKNWRGLMMKVWYECAPDEYRCMRVKLAGVRKYPLADNYEIGRLITNDSITTTATTTTTTSTTTTTTEVKNTTMLATTTPVTTTTKLPKEKRVTIMRGLKDVAQGLSPRECGRLGLSGDVDMKCVCRNHGNYGTIMSTHVQGVDKEPGCHATESYPGLMGCKFAQVAPYKHEVCGSFEGVTKMSVLVWDLRDGAGVWSSRWNIALREKVTVERNTVTIEESDRWQGLLVSIGYKCSSGADAKCIVTKFDGERTYPLKGVLLNTTQPPSTFAPVATSPKKEEVIQKEKEEKMSIGAIAGLISACIGSLIVIAAVFYFIFRCRKTKSVAEDAQAGHIYVEMNNGDSRIATITRDDKPINEPVYRELEPMDDDSLYSEASPPPVSKQPGGGLYNYAYDHFAQNRPLSAVPILADNDFDIYSMVDDPPVRPQGNTAVTRVASQMSDTYSTVAAPEQDPALELYAKVNKVANHDG